MGVAWLACAGPQSHYFAGVALPMVVLGIGQGIGLGPLTVAGVAGVPAKDAGAASGVVNMSHQLGGSMGLAILVLVFAASAQPAEDPVVNIAHRISWCLTAGAAMLTASFLVAWWCIVRQRVAQQPAGTKI
jgi:sugar phosphate permease